MPTQTRSTAVVTGAGMITPLGAGVAVNYQRLCAGDQGTRPDPLQNGGRSRQHFGKVTAETLEPTFKVHKGLRRQDRTVALALAAVGEALEQAGLGHAPGGAEPFRAERIALCLGTSSGPTALQETAMTALATGGEAGLKRAAPLAAINASFAAITGEIARRHDIRGPSFTVNAECASGNTVLALGQMLLESGAADVVLCCAVDSALAGIAVAQSNLIGALAAGACHPFDERRDGFAMSEGAAAVVLETAECATRRGATAQATVLGVGMTTDTGHATAPAEDGEPLAGAILAALANADLTTGEIGVVSAHGTGTPRNDPAELNALRTVFGQQLSTLPIHAVKSSIGHTLAAAGLIEAIILIQTLREGWIPPAIECERPIDTGVDLVRGTQRWTTAEMGLSTSCGFGGNNTALVLSAPRAGHAGRKKA